MVVAMLAKLTEAGHDDHGFAKLNRGQDAAHASMSDKEARCQEVAAKLRLRHCGDRVQVPEGATGRTRLRNDGNAGIVRRPGVEPRQ